MAATLIDRIIIIYRHFKAIVELLRNAIKKKGSAAGKPI